MLKWVVGKKMEMFVLNFYKIPTFWFIIIIIFCILFGEERDIKWQWKKKKI